MLYYQAVEFKRISSFHAYRAKKTERQILRLRMHNYNRFQPKNHRFWAIMVGFTGTSDPLEGLCGGLALPGTPKKAALRRTHKAAYKQPKQQLSLKQADYQSRTTIPSLPTK
jgi:hypothetical protein